ncbi:MAG: carboxypeptidase regulatory-like domain-containing protein [Myxococcales bacterium]|nr:carboxypeptidase regulatory-like domain-containing protein [Myxococcales bacterium]
MVYRQKLLCPVAALVVLGITAPLSAQDGQDGQDGQDASASADASISLSTAGEAQASTDAATEPAAEPATESAAEAGAAYAAGEAESREGALVKQRTYSGLGGSSGGLFVDDPGGAAAAGAVRVQLGLSTFTGSSFLYKNDEVELDQQWLTFSWTAIEMLEVYGGLTNRAMVADEPRPLTLHSMGHLFLGGKVGFQVAPILRVGGGLRLMFANDLGTRETPLDSTSIGLRAGVALDLQELPSPVPLIARFNLDYLFDNSAGALEELEADRYDRLGAPLDKQDEVRHLATRVDRLGLGINRVDRLTLGLGVELPFAPVTDFYLHPMLEWRMALPSNRQAYDCPFFSTDDTAGSTASGADDTCLNEAGFDAAPMNLTLGLRVAPPVRGISVAFGVDFALNGSDTFVRELEPTVPYQLLLTLGYDYDGRPPEPKIVRIEPPPPPPPPPVKGRIAGKVTNATSGEPVGGAVVRIVGTELTPLATDASGAFTTYELDPGVIELQLSHPDYSDGSCSATIPVEGGEASVDCTMTALPEQGDLSLRLVDALGAAVANVQVVLTGPSNETLTSDGSGEVKREGLPAGVYRARIVSDAHLIQVRSLTIETRQTARLSLALAAKPATSGVRKVGDQLVVKALRFSGDSIELPAEAASALAEIADMLLRSPEISKLTIRANGGDELALPRAIAIKQRLVESGVEEDRVEANGESAARVQLSISTAAAESDED